MAPQHLRFRFRGPHPFPSNGRPYPYLILSIRLYTVSVPGDHESPGKFDLNPEDSVS